MRPNNLTTDRPHDRTAAHVRRVHYLDACNVAEMAELVTFYGGHVGESSILRRALAALAERVGSLDSESRAAAEERAAVLAFVRPRRAGVTEPAPVAAESVGF